MKVELRNISKSFDTNKIVDNVTLNISDGEMFFLLGPSGCGKTTILRMIAGFYEPEEGEIIFGDRKVNGIPSNKRNTALVFQNYAVWPHLTVFENVAYGLRVRNLDEVEIQKRTEQALDQVKILNLAKRKPVSLSGGQQQRVALARAIVVNPDVLLFDEPLSNLDAKLRLEVRDEIKRLHAAQRITSIYVTHDQEEALSLADRIAVMHGGIIQQVGTPIEIYNNPANPFVASFIGEINLFSSDSPIAVKLGAGQGTTIGFRPERVVIAKEGGIRAKIETATYLGSKSQIILKTENGEEVKAWSGDYHQAGTEVHFTVLPEHILKYPEGGK